MTVSSIERAQTRYAHTVYRSALLRDPHPGRAAAAVIAAFAAQDWANFGLDDNSEARLIASLPPMPRWSVRRRAALAPLPASFWRLPAATRLALGLRLLRDFSTAQIALALKQPLETVGDVLIDGLAAVAEVELPPTVECRAFRRARLDDPVADRSHLIGCASCRLDAAAWEAAETRLADQLGRAVGGVLLPPSSLAEVQALAQGAGGQPAPATWRTPWRLQLALLGVILAVLASVVWWPRRSAPLAPPPNSSKTLSPQHVLAQAQAQYIAVPSGNGIIHRRWLIALDKPYLRLEADEWIDPQQPAHHRMQLLDGRAIKAWQYGDGSQTLSYVVANDLANMFCDTPILEAQSRFAINRWSLPTADQAKLRTARWQSGPWAIGLHYLTLAAGASTITSLGTTGSGDQATLTLAASGPDINGTLLLRFDALHYGLQQVRLITINNGLTEDRMPWDLVLHETIDHGTARRENLLRSYPPAERFLTKDAAGALDDPACPITNDQQRVSLPQALERLDRNVMPGLPKLPTGTERVVITAAQANQRGWQDPIAPENLGLIYSGPGKRLKISLVSSAEHGGVTTTLGLWQVHVRPHLPGIVTAYAELDDPSNLGFSLTTNGNNQTSLFVWAEGWSQSDLAELIKQIQPLHVHHWLGFYDQLSGPKLLDPASLALARQVAQAAAPQPGMTYHAVTERTVRQAPALAGLRDPYHRSVKTWPPTRQEQVWLQLDPNSQQGALLVTQTITDGTVLEARWKQSEALMIYDGISNTLVSHTLRLQHWALPGVELRPLISQPFTWTSLPDGRIIAELHQPIAQSRLADQLQALGSVDELDQEPWIADLKGATISERYEWAADGTLQQQRLWASVHGPSRQLMLESTNILTRTWLSSVPTTTFSFNLPRATRMITANPDDYVGSYLATRRAKLAETQAETAFPLWYLPDAELRFSDAERAFQSTPPPLRSNLTLENVIEFGLAVRLNYIGDRGECSLLQGPANRLRRMLQQQSPLWDQSRPIVLTIAGIERPAWIMEHSAKPFEYWLIFELDDQLFFFTHHGSPESFEQLLRQASLLQRFEAQS